MGSGITQAVFVAVAGYWFLMRWSPTRYEVVRQAGYHLFFKSILYGIFLTIPGFLCIIVVRLLFYGFQLPLSNAEILFGSLSGLALAGAAPEIWDRLSRSRERQLEHILKAAAERGDFLEILLETAKICSGLVEMSLKNGKVYIGFIAESGITSRGENTDILLVPACSGYREKDTRTLLINYDYSAVVLPQQEPDAPEGGITGSRGGDFCVVIPIDQVEIARIIPPERLLEYEMTPDCKVVGAADGEVA